MSKQAVRHRRQKIEAEIQKPTPKDKFLKSVAETEEVMQQVVPKFTPATQNQKLQLQYLRDGRSVVWAVGAAGSGKSMVAAYHAATLLKQKQIEKITLIRPVVYVGNSIGMLSGSANEKLMVWFKQTLSHLEKFLGVGYLHYCLDKEIISFQALEHCRGMSFENQFVILEECQGLTLKEYEMILTRIGKGGQICMTGDEAQTAARDNSGLTRILSMVQHQIDTEPMYMSDDDLDTLNNDLGVVRYTVDDIQRSGIVKAMCKMFYYDNGNSL